MMCGLFTPSYLLGSIARGEYRLRIFLSFFLFQLRFRVVNCALKLYFLITTVTVTDSDRLTARQAGTRRTLRVPTCLSGRRGCPKSK